MAIVIYAVLTVALTVVYWIEVYLSEPTTVIGVESVLVGVAWIGLSVLMQQRCEERLRVKRIVEVFE